MRDFIAYFRLKRPTHNLRVLDGFRAFAILLVIHCHWSLSFTNSPDVSLSAQRFLMPLTNGLIGVDLFFVLSGFLITHHIFNRYLENKEEISFRWKNYLSRRILRIFPAFYVSILLTAAFSAYVMDNSAHLFDRVFVNFVFLQDYIPTDLPIGSWSLGVEEKFYLLAPLLMLGLARLKTTRARVMLVMVIFCLSPLARYMAVLEHPALYTDTEVKYFFRYPFHLNFESITLGIICALLYRSKAFMDYARANQLGGVLFFFGGILLVFVLGLVPHKIQTIDGITPYHAPSVMVALLPTITAISFGALVMGALIGTKAAKFLESGFLYPIAVFSFSMYLIHLMTLYFAIHLTHAGLAGVLGHGLTDFAPLLQMMLTLPGFWLLTFFGAAAMYYGVERPFLKLRR